MKRLILILLIVFSFFGITKKAFCDDLDEEINLIVGINLKNQMNRASEERVQEANKGISLGLEDLVPVCDDVRFGLGFEYNIFPVNINKSAISALAMYATVKVKPFMNTNKNMLQRVYLKGNLGYSKALIKLENIFNKGGLYYAIGAGIETKKNIFFELSYSVINSSSKVSELISNTNTSFSKVGVNVGYKFYY
jgi:hypothetical protein